MSNINVCLKIKLMIMKNIFLLTFLFLAFTACKKEENLPATNVPVDNGTEGYRMLLMGNSFFRPYAENLDVMAIDAGFVDHNSTIVIRGGENGRAINFWNDSTSIEHSLIKSTLDEGGIDYLGMTSGHDTINRVEGFQFWIDYALQNNPNITIFISLAPFDFPAGDPNGTRPDWHTLALENGFISI